ncbi:hypothetical protein CPAV1605_309 [seawater metagenome]|uniref:Uncharacterized protein n=1 Tax=seawater metagenome TaxID=1561972 RepID=A0A5E8CIT9_9ZZZZ
MTGIVLSNTMSQVILLGIVGGIIYYTYITPYKTKVKIGKKLKTDIKDQFYENAQPKTNNHCKTASCGSTNSNCYSRGKPAEKSYYLFTDEEHFKTEFLKLNVEQLSNDEIMNWFQTLQQKEVIN